MTSELATTQAAHVTSVITPAIAAPALIGLAAPSGVIPSPAQPAAITIVDPILAIAQSAIAVSTPINSVVAPATLVPGITPVQVAINAPADVLATPVIEIAPVAIPVTSVAAPLVAAATPLSAVA